MTSEIPKGYARVSQISGCFKDFSHIDPAVLKNAATRGTKVHRYCELFVKNLLIEEPEKDCKPYFDSFVKWYEETVEIVVETETRFSSEDLKLTGQIDLICELKGSQCKVLIDIKTPQNACPSWRLQTAGYLLLCIDKRRFISRRTCLMLNKNGSPAKIIEYTDHEKDIRLFKNALELYHFQKGNN